MSASGPNPTGDTPSWGQGWMVGLRIWIERAGQAILGKGRLHLLEGIERHCSISAAAREMGMSYRRAWTLVQDINRAADEPLVVAATGGSHGGGAKLTPLGRWAVTVFRELQDQLHQTAAGILPQLVQRPSSPTLHVAAAVSLEEVVGQLLNDFALREPTVRVRAVFGGSDELADNLLAGAPADLFLTADPHQLDRLQAAQLVRKEQCVPLAQNSLAVIGLADRVLPVRKLTDLVRPNAPRLALADPDCPLGGYTRAYLESHHVYEPLHARAVHVENSRAVVTAVRAGQAEVGFVYASDAARAEGCRTLFRVRRTPTPILYTAAILNRGHDTTAAARLLAFLTSSEATYRFRRCGFLPPGRRPSASH
jgi:molybdenum ABC transporter molybdate-binding protein